MASPTDILVTGGIVGEGAPAGTVVAVLDAVDADAGDSFTYTLTDDLSGFFEIVGKNIRVKAGAVLDYEAIASHQHTITVQVTDSTGGTYQEEVAIIVQNLNEIAGTGEDDPALNGTTSDDLIEALGGNDTVDSGSGSDTVFGGDGDDSIYGGDDDDTLLGDAGNDYLSGGEGNDTLDVGLDGGAAIGEGGNDRLTGSDVDDFLSGGGGNDTINAGGGADGLIDDNAVGSTGIDVLNGGAGNDDIASLGGADTIDGGDGDDKAHIHRGLATAAFLIEMVDTATVTEIGDGTTFVNVENLTFESGSGDDVVTTLGGDDKIFGGAGNDTLSGGGGTDILSGDAGEDTLSGGPGQDTLWGGADGDTLDTGADGGYAHGEAGDDGLTGGDGADALNGGADNDTISAGGGADTILDDDGSNLNTDALDGGAGDDTIYSHGGADTIDGGADTDKVVINRAAVTTAVTVVMTGNPAVTGVGEGATFVNVEVLQFIGGAGDDVVLAIGGNDDLAGGDGGDTLSSDAGDDQLFGDNGDDFLTGGGDDDWLDGGVGSDKAIYSGNRSDYQVTRNPDGSLTIADLRGGAPDGTDNVIGVESFAFADGEKSLDQLLPNNAPTITSNGGGQTAAISVAENTTAVATVSATDPDAGDQVTYSIVGGFDGNLFTIDSQTGALSFTQSQDYENPNLNGGWFDYLYDVQVRATDSEGAFDDQLITVTLTDENEVENDAPIFVGDGLPEILVANNGGGQVKQNGGDFNFTTSTTFAVTGGFPYGMDAADVNGDGRLDFAVTGDNGYGRLYLNNGDGTFTDSGNQFPAQFQSRAYFLDVNNDGQMELAFLNIHGSVDIYSNDGTGTFSLTQQFASGTGSMNFGDLNGDGFVDLVLSESFTSEKIYFNNGSGQFQPSDQQFPALESGGNALADLDGDGDLDLVVATVTQPTQVYFNDGQGEMVDTGQALDEALLVLAGDVNEDGHTDLVTSNSVESKLYLNDGSGGFSSPVSLQFPVRQLVDLNGDGHLDAVANNYPDNLTIYRGDGTGSFSAAATIAGQTNTFLVADTGLGDGSISVTEKTTSVAQLRAFDANPGQTLTYSIAGGADASRFAIDPTSGALSFIPAPDFESPADSDADNIYQVSVEVSDGNGGTATRDLVITVTNSASGLTLDNSSIDENATGSTLVGLLTPTDPADAETITLVDDGGGFFALVNGNELVVAEGALLDAETQASHQITVRVTDAGGASRDKTFIITVNDVNEEPTSLTVTGDTIAEDATEGLLVGTLSSTDPDSGDTLTYSLTDDGGGLFTLVDNKIQVAAGASFDFETDETHTISVDVTDSGGLTRSATITINVTNVNEQPDSLVVTGNEVDENAVAGTVVATIDATDPDAGDSLTFSLADNAGGRFVIVDNEIRVADGADLDFEVDTEQAIVVNATDAAGLTRSVTVTINVLNVDEAPNAIELTGGEVKENSPAGTVVATLEGSDPDGPGGLAFVLIDDADGRFEIVGNSIVVAAGAVLDFEQQPSHNVTVEVTDPSGLSYTESFEITIINANEAPTDIGVTGGTVTENQAPGALVAVLNAVDADAGDTLEFTIDDPSGLFEIVGNEIRVAAGAQIDFETAMSHIVTLTVTDGSGETYQEELIIQVQNVAPVIIGTAAANTLPGTSEEDQIFGRAGNDTLSGLAGSDELFGEVGNDRLTGGAGVDTLSGGAGNDTYTLTADDPAEDTVVELSGEGTDTVETDQSYTLTAFVENLFLTGSASIDGTGNELSNTITGNTGSNVLDGGAAADTMRGGQGDDVYYVESIGDAVTESSNSGSDEVRTTLTSYLLVGNVERLTYTGVANFTGTGNSLANTITGGNGGDTLDGLGGADILIGIGGDDTYVVNNVGDQVVEAADEGFDTVRSSVTYTLGSDVDQLILTGSGGLGGTGNELNNSLIGNTGANTLDGGLGLDILTGGSGNDTYIVTDVGDTIVEAAGAGTGTDTVRTSLVSYLLDTNVENLIFTGGANFAGTGNALANIITGGDGNDTLTGGLGDTLRGLAGNDTYVVDISTATVTEGSNAGIDIVQSSANFTLGANLENLMLTGTASNGTGNGLANVIMGNSSSNTLSGQGGNDRLIGADGNDTLTGGTANDVYVFGESFGRDVISGFSLTGSSSDQIEFSNSVFTSFAAVQAAMAQVGANAVITYDTNNTITLTGVNVANLNAGDFVFV
ncbi:cadherin domain-containing protein [Mesorhizobium sp. LHD-90]|uniref:calcium-binding protein n=1 Tax=Mesorhizobium sp. LHD-90 TaxID=3071414 RepID=UPI0027DFC55A|nr:cadherin domain-containing protein [Mesorhizobium sp. LHD-90]MDQ6434370.1 cadherin domain-containing protein [Mesorhizobium sp. LHD-90]